MVGGLTFDAKIPPQGDNIAGDLTGLFGGLSIGAWLWGEAAVHVGVPTALFCAGGFLSLGCLATRWLPIPDKFADA